MHMQMTYVKLSIQEEIARRLDLIEQEETVRVVYACESGSRAWGFESVDSDYDVRFLYVHPRDWYLSVEDRRDVIERPVQNALDLSGWDLLKALRLFRKSNPPLLEWFVSPIVYRESGRTAQKLRGLADQFHSPRASAYHYLHMAQGNFREYLRGDEVWTKKYLYVLRPLLAIQWIERGLGIVPMEFQKLVEALLPVGPLRTCVDDLVKRKRAGSELTRGPRVAPISEFIESELARHEGEFVVPQPWAPPADKLDIVFHQTLAETQKGS